jgi:hypothetical protein
MELGVEADDAAPQHSLYFNFVNRIALGLGVELEPASGVNDGGG